MRDEIEKLIRELRQAEWNPEREGYIDAKYPADRLQSILDADYVAKDSQLGCSCPCHEQDPVARLEAMNWRVFVDEDGDVCWELPDEDGCTTFSVRCDGERPTVREICDTATRLLALVESKTQQAQANQDSLRRIEKEGERCP